MLDKIKENGKYVPLVLGTADQWEAATMGFQNIGPNYWKGEEGRKALIAGTAKLTDPPYVETFAQLAKWAPYLGDGYQAQKYPDSQNLFTLGQAAIYAGRFVGHQPSEKQADFEFGAFPPPVAKAGDTCYISDHTDIGIGLNAKSANAGRGEEIPRLGRLAGFRRRSTPTRCPASIPLSTRQVTIENKVAQKFVGWRGTCEETIRNSYQILSRGTPNLENELWNVSVGVLNGTMTPEDAAKKVQEGLDAWYKPSRADVGDGPRRRIAARPFLDFVGQVRNGEGPVNHTNLPHAEVRAAKAASLEARTTVRRGSDDCDDRRTRRRVDTRDRTPWTTYVIVFLAPAVIIYTRLLDLPARSTRSASASTRSDRPARRIFVGFDNFRDASHRPALVGAVLERLPQQPGVLRHPHGRAELDRAGARRAAQPAGARRPQRLPHAHLPADHAVGRHHRLHLAAHPIAALGHRRRARSPRSASGSLFAPWLGLESTALVTVSLISVWQFVGIPMMLIYAALLNIPDDLVDAATVDGANQWQRLLVREAAARSCRRSASSRSSPSSAISTPST